MPHINVIGYNPTILHLLQPQVQMAPNVTEGAVAPASHHHIASKYPPNHRIDMFLSMSPYFILVLSRKAEVRPDKEEMILPPSLSLLPAW